MKTFWRFLFLLLLASTSWAATESEKKFVSELPVATNFSPQSYVLINTGNPPKSVITTVSNVLNVMQTLPNFTNGLGGGGGGGNDKIATNRGTGFFNTFLGSTNRARDLSVTNRAALWGGYHIGTSNHTVYVDGSPGSSTLIFSNSAIAAPWLTFSEGADTLTLRNGTVSGALNANGAFTANNIAEFNDAVQVDGQMSVNNVSAFNRAPVFNTNASLSQLPSVPTPSASLLSLYGKAHESTTRLFYKDHLGNEFGPLGVITNGGTLEVRKNGNDANAIRGRGDRPWLTVSNALKQAQDNDTVLIYPGIYEELNGLGPFDYGLSNRSAMTLYGRSGLTIQGIGNPRIVMTNIANGLELFGCKNIVIDGLTFQGLRLPGSALTNVVSMVLLREGCENIRFRNCVFTNIMDHAIMAGYFLGSTNVFIEGTCEFYNVGCTSDVPALVVDGSCVQAFGSSWQIGSIRMDRFFRGIELYGSNNVNITIDRPRMTRCWYQGVVTVPSDNTLSFKNSFISIDFKEAEFIGREITPISLRYGDNILIQDCRLSLENCRYGMSLGTPDVVEQGILNSIIRNNVLAKGTNNVGAASFLTGIAVQQYYAGPISNLVISGNTLCDMLGPGLDLSLRDSLIFNNTLQNVSTELGQAIYFQNVRTNSQNNRIINNYISTPGTYGIQFANNSSSPTNNIICGNVFAKFGTAPIFVPVAESANVINFNLTTNLLFCGTNHLTSCFTNGGSGSATNAITLVQTNGATFLTGATAINFSNGANVTVSGSVVGTTGLVTIASSGGGSGIATQDGNGTNTTLVTAKAITVTNLIVNGSAFFASNSVISNVTKKASSATSHSNPLIHIHSGDPGTDLFWAWIFASATNTFDSNGSFDYLMTIGLNPNSSPLYKTNKPSITYSTESEYVTSQLVRQGEHYMNVSASSTNTHARPWGWSFDWDEVPPRVYHNWQLEQWDFLTRDGLASIAITSDGSQSNKAAMTFSRASRLDFSGNTNYFQGGNLGFVANAGVLLFGQTTNGLTMITGAPYGPTNAVVILGTEDPGVGGRELKLLIGKQDRDIGFKWSSINQRLERNVSGSTWEPFNVFSSGIQVQGGLSNEFRSSIHMNNNKDIFIHTTRALILGSADASVDKYQYISGDVGQNNLDFATFAQHTFKTATTVTGGGTERFAIADAGTTNSVPAVFKEAAVHQKTLYVAGGLNLSRFATNANVTMTTNFFTWAITSVAVLVTNTLPTAAQCAGLHVVVKDEGGNASATNLAIVPVAGDRIDGATSLAINSNYGFKRLYSAGSTNWFTE